MPTKTNEEIRWEELKTVIKKIVSGYYADDLIKDIESILSSQRTQIAEEVKNNWNYDLASENTKNVISQVLKIIKGE